MRETIADALRKEGRAEGALRARREMFLRLLQQRFGKVTRAVRATIETTQDIEQLERWFDRAATGNVLEDVGIPPKR